MIGSLRTLTGDALVAIGSKLRAPRSEFDEWAATEYLLAGPAGAMECDGPQATWVEPTESNGLSRPVELAKAEDSTVLRMAASVIAGWKPILLLTTGNATDVDALVDELHDRATQFAAIERDADCAFLSPAHLGAHLTRSAQPASE